MSDFRIYMVKTLDFPKPDFRFILNGKDFIDI